MPPTSNQDAARYAKLRDWLLANHVINYTEVSEEQGEPFVMGSHFFGSSFEAAVDTIDDDVTDTVQKLRSKQQEP